MRIKKALDIAMDFGSIDGSDRKQWVIDQMVRALTGRFYGLWIKWYRYRSGEEWDPGEWDIGIAT